MDPYLPRRMSSANPFASLFRGMSQDLEHADPPEPTLNDQLQEIFSFTLNEKATLTKEVSPLRFCTKNQYCNSRPYFVNNPVQGPVSGGCTKRPGHHSPEHG